MNKKDQMILFNQLRKKNNQKNCEIRQTKRFQNKKKIYSQDRKDNKGGKKHKHIKRESPRE